jgi:hypothetical protein
MNAATPEAPQKPRRLRWWLAAGLLLLASPFVFVGLAAWSVLTLDRDAAFLRREVMAATGSHWHRKVQVSVGGLVIGALRTGLVFLPRKEHLDEARQALAAVQRASVGVYEADARNADANIGFARLIESADRAMGRRGWSRLVGVHDGHSTVLVYSNADPDPEGRIDLCLAVLDGDNLVVASTRVRAEKLRELVERHMPAGGLRQKLKLAKI